MKYYVLKFKKSGVVCVNMPRVLRPSVFLCKINAAKSHFFLTPEVRKNN